MMRAPWFAILLALVVASCSLQDFDSLSNGDASTDVTTSPDALDSGGDTLGDVAGDTITRDVATDPENRDVPAGIHCFDGDRDGFGDPENCTPDPGPNRVENGDDCDDTDAGISPSAAEVCDGVDTDCDGNVDSGEGMTFVDGEESLQVSVDRAAVGETLCLASVIHEGGTDIDTAIRLAGRADMPHPIIDGGGTQRVLNLNTDCTLERITIRNGNDPVTGGVSIARFVTVRLEDVVIDGNTATGDAEGAGLHVAGSATLNGVTIRNNVANGPQASGAGVFVSGSVEMNNVRVLANRASVSAGEVLGAGIHVTGALRATNLILAGNEAGADGEVWGVGMYVGSGTATMTNATIVKNTSQGPGQSLGSGVAVRGAVTPDSVVLVNTITAVNEAPAASQGVGIYLGSSGTTSLSYSNTNSNTARAVTANFNMIIPTLGPGVLNEDPGFEGTSFDTDASLRLPQAHHALTQGIQQLEMPMGAAPTWAPSADLALTVGSTIRDAATRLGVSEYRRN